MYTYIGLSCYHLLFYIQTFMKYFIWARERGRIHGSLSANSLGYAVATATAQMDE